MAGNTKLLGFTPNGKLTLSRWGKDVIIDVSPGSLSAIREACTSKLPIKPRDQLRTLSFNAEYDESIGSVELRLSPDVAAKFVDIMRAWRDEGRDGAGKAGAWAEEIKNCCQAHTDYHSTEGEPGVEDPQVPH